MMNAPSRTFAAVPAVRGEEPLAIGMIGPPGGGKTYSSLRIAKGIQAVRGGDIILIDTESGRSRKYADEFKFRHVDFKPPCRPSDFLEAIRQQLPANPACIIVDSMSDEHEGVGGYLEFHDEMIAKMGGNEWAAWAHPKASRKRLITGLLHIVTPLIFCFRAREKTQQVQDGSRKKVINIGWQPVAPLEIVHALDLTCILPPRADGVPIWKSDKIGEDFIIKLPVQFKKLFTGDDRQLTEDIGRALAEWSRGPSSPQPSPSTPNAQAAAGAGAPGNDPPPGVPALPDIDWAEYCVRVEAMLEEATTAQAVTAMWNGGKALREKINPSDEQFEGLKARVLAVRDRLKQTAHAEQVPTK